jgi:hypothetical protein
MQRLAAVFLQHRRRWARLVLGLGLVVLATRLWPSWPRETQLEYVLGPDHAEVVELRVDFVDHGEALHGVRFGFPDGAPASVRHHLTLPAGELLLRCQLRARDGHSRLLTRRLRAPAPGVVRIALAGGRS